MCGDGVGGRVSGVELEETSDGGEARTDGRKGDVGSRGEKFVLHVGELKGGMYLRIGMGYNCINGREEGRVTE